MSENKIITLLKSGNRMVVDSIDSDIIGMLIPCLEFTTRKFLRGYERRLQNGKAIELIEYTCWAPDHRGRIATSFGFHARITARLKQAGISTVIRNLSPNPNPKIFDPAWDRLYNPAANIDLRYRQEEFLMRVTSSIKQERSCRADCPPGFGKSMSISLLATLLFRARIHVVTKRVPVLLERIYPQLVALLPDVGICCGAKKILGRRVMLYSVDSLHHSDGDCDICIADECHELAADDAATQMARYDRSVNVGLSATHDMRLDCKDYRVEAMFGPVVFSMNYQEAATHGLVVPIEVYWTDVISDIDPCSGMEDTEKLRWGIWRNDQRNDAIASDARRESAETQTLITVTTIEHALNLKKRLPEYQLVYREDGITPTDQRYYAKLGLWPEGEPQMTSERRSMLAKMFERNKLKKVIATTVWNVGVSFDYLELLIRADAGGSDIMDTQIPGRTSRIGQKIIGRVRDYNDQFNKGFRRKAQKRRANYEAQGWMQIDAKKRTTSNDGRPQATLWLED